MTSWLLYGANGYTGELIAREAVKRGLRPILAGRSAEKIERLARELGLQSRVFDLDRPELEGVKLVLHCAGPFILTAKPMVKACLAAGVHYLDITGEIGVFEMVFSKHDEAVKRGVTLLPGVGFDVVPTDCLAAKLHQMMPDAVELSLAFQSNGGVSPGTFKTMIEGADRGSAIRRDGKIVGVPHLFDVREIPFATGKRTAMAIPWGDVSTAYRTTGIPNIRVYSTSSPRAIKRLRRMLPLMKLLKIKPLKRFLQHLASKRTGPSAETRATARVELWGRVTNAAGQELTLTSNVAEGYAFTVVSSLAAVQRVLAGDGKPGAWTPAGLFGAHFVDEIEN